MLYRGKRNRTKKLSPWERIDKKRDFFNIYDNDNKILCTRKFSRYV